MGNDVILPFKHKPINQDEGFGVEEFVVCLLDLGNKKWISAPQLAFFSNLYVDERSDYN